MQQLNLPPYEHRIIQKENKDFIFDTIRKRYIVLTPEEWVRQNFIQYLNKEKKYPAALMAVEKQLVVNTNLFRFDLVVYRRNGIPLLIAEFKAPGVKISQAAFDQAVRYNMALKVEHVVISNGLQHFSCEINYIENSYKYLKEIPEYGY